MLRAGDAACSQVNELMTELDELRAELLRTCSCLTQSNAERNASAARVEQLEGSLQELSQQVTSKKRKKSSHSKVTSKKRKKELSQQQTSNLGYLFTTQFTCFTRKKKNKY